jgi:hypothetical protein
VALDWTLDLLFSKDLVQFLEIKANIVTKPAEAASISPTVKSAAGAD